MNAPVEESPSDTPLRSLLADALVWHEVSQGRSRLARHLSPARADAVLAALALDHVVVPRALVHQVLTSYADDKAKGGPCDPGLEDLALFYEHVSGWRPLVQEAT